MEKWFFDCPADMDRACFLVAPAPEHAESTSEKSTYA